MIRFHFRLSLSFGSGKEAALELSAGKRQDDQVENTTATANVTTTNAKATATANTTTTTTASVATAKAMATPPRRNKRAAQMLVKCGTALARKAQPSTSQNYLTAIRSFLRFCQTDDIALSQITQSRVCQYEQWLLRNDVNINTVSCYMRSLRAVYNKATRRRMGSRHPFARVFTGNSVTEKRSLSEDDIRRIALLPLKPGTTLSLTRDTFLFSVYCLGMPFIDIAFLRRSQLKDGYLTYHRHKTGQRIRMQIEPCMASIIRRYERDGSPYVFPILTETDPRRAYRQYQSKLNYHNRLLKQIAAQAGISLSLSSYCARHTWATTAYHQNVDLPTISKAMGHTHPNTTLIYLKEVNDDRLYTANKKILKSFLRLPLRKR